MRTYIYELIGELESLSENNISYNMIRYTSDIFQIKYHIENT